MGEIQFQHKPKGVSIIYTETISCDAHRDLRQLDVESKRLCIQVLVNRGAI